MKNKIKSILVLNIKRCMKDAAKVMVH